MTARNAISETHDIKISRRSIPPDSLKLRDFGARGGPPNNFNPATALGIEDKLRGTKEANKG